MNKDLLGESKKNFFALLESIKDLKVETWESDISINFILNIYLKGKMMEVRKERGSENGRDRERKNE